MAEVKDNYIATNALKAHGKAVAQLKFGSDNVKRAWMRGNIVWDIWETILSANDTSISSSYTELTKSLLGVLSYGTDALSVTHDLGYSINPSSVSANTSDSTKSHSVQVTLSNTGNSVNVTVTQAGRVLSTTTYGRPSITSTSISSVPASGNVTRYLTVNWSLIKTLVYDNGTTSSSTVTGSSTATVTNGSSSVGAYINGGGIYVPSAGTTTYPNDHVAYTISQFNFTANGVSSGTVSITVYLYRGANTAGTTSWGSYNLSISHSPTGTLSNVGGTKTISVTCTQNGTIPYTSGSSAATTRNATATLSTTIGTLSTTSITGSGTATLNVLENTGAARTISVTAKVSSTSKSTSFTQSAVVWVFTATNATMSVGYDTTSVKLTGTSTRNGFVQTIQKRNVTLGSYTVFNPSISSVTTSDAGVFTIVITFGANDLTSSRNLSVAVTQPLSGKTLTFKITQAAKPAPNNIYWVRGTGYWVAGGNFTFGATLAFAKSLEGYDIPISVIKGTTETRSETVTMLKTGTDGDYYTMEVQLMDKETDDGSVFYMEATYGEETERITLKQFTPTPLYE